MRLHVGVFGAEKPFDTLYGQGLRAVYLLAAAVVAVAGIALGVLVGEARPHGAQHLLAYKVLAGNQLYALALAAVFSGDNLKNLFVLFHILGFISGIIYRYSLVVLYIRLRRRRLRYCDLHCGVSGCRQHLRRRTSVPQS